MFINNSALIRCVFVFVMSFPIWAQAQDNKKIHKTVKIPLPGSEAKSALLTDIDLSDGANPDDATVTFISTYWMNGDSYSQLESAKIINANIDSIIL